MDLKSENTCFGGVQGVYSHPSKICGVEMTFGLYLPEEAKYQRVPILWYLSGLTCNHENAMTKAGAQAWAAEHGIALVFPDTSPRGGEVADDEAFDLGQGAGFYVNATQEPWAAHFQMWDYIAEELPQLLGDEFSVDLERQAITGHSMGGHGALTIAMARPQQYRSVSAFSPICNPMRSDWGRKQLTAYIGTESSNWETHDASLQMLEKGFDGPVLIDTGTNDQFLELLKPETLAFSMAKRRQQGHIRFQPDYDHSYFFVSTFIEDHINFHADALHAE
ncbi:MAG: S-formylglutathione hydrolase, partial [Planktomarina sp.]|jgi:S-formylglutathione hydrolase|nr:S-formylglutathione hydrolase [Planktomarina sp.]MDS9932406.1 S-formylglutathione hydrolase [Planktomarina sp.]